ncbi:hypothetical protein, partial [Burkholderia mallei]|uniref:hypothetical protein n=1 Tax=Burkholderia mallei TaxID=13373 RepID=UPI001E4BBA3E
MIVSIDPIARRVIARGPPGGLPQDSPGRRSAHLRCIVGASSVRSRAAHDAGPRRGRASRAKKNPPRRRVQIADKPSPSGGFLFFNGVMLKT